MDSYEKSLNYVCRLCLGYDECNKITSLVDYDRESGFSDFGDSLKNLTSLNIDFDDNLPKNICVRCRKELKRIEHFKSMCKKNCERLNLLVNYYYKSSSKEAKMEAVIQYSLFTQYFPDRYQQSCLKKLKRLPLKHAKKKKHKNGVIKLRKLNSDTTRSCKNETALQNLGVEIDYSESYNFSDQESYNLSIEDLSQSKTKTFDSFLDQMESIFTTNDLKPSSHSHSNILSHHETQNTPMEGESQSKAKTIDSILDQMENVFTKTDPKPQNNNLSSSKAPTEDKSQAKAEAIDSFLDQMEAIFTKSCRKLKQKRQIFYKPLHQNLTCNVCNKKLANKNTYRAHMQSHESYLFICDQCGKGFATKTSMNIHLVARHGVSSSFECDICCFKAPRRIELIEHIRLHTGERPFTCEKCGTSFRRRAIYTSHLKCHDEKKVQCPKCPKKFYRPGEMKAHMNNVHERIYLYLCRICNSSYARNTTVRKHMASKHGIAKENQGKILRVTKNTHRGLFKETKDNEFE